MMGRRAAWGERSRFEGQPVPGQHVWFPDVRGQRLRGQSSLPGRFSVQVDRRAAKVERSRGEGQPAPGQHLGNLQVGVKGSEGAGFTFHSPPTGMMDRRAAWGERSKG